MPEPETDIPKEIKPPLSTETKAEPTETPSTAEEPKRGFFSRGKFIPPAKLSEAVSDKELTALKDKAALADKYRDQLARLQADFDNYRKRIAREKEENAAASRESLLKKLLPVLDDFERAAAAVQNDGVNLVLGKFHAALADLGLEEIKAVGQPFNPHQHEAIAQVHHDSHPEGTIVEQPRKGYTIGARLLRPASVVISKGKAEK